MATLKPILQKQFLVIIDQLQTTYWTKATRPKVTRETADYNDGQTGTVKKMLGFTSRDNITLSKPFDPTADKAITDWYTELQKNESEDRRFSVSLQPVQADRQGNTIKGVTITLTGCQLVSFSAPEVDRMGTSAAMIEIEICYDDISFQ